MRFREALQREFDRRRSVNPRYSLRSWARAMGVDHASMSQILRGHRRLTAKKVRAFCARLGIPATEAEEYCALEQEAVLLDSVSSGSYRADSRRLAMTLGIPVDQVNITLQRVLRKRMMIMKERDCWVRAEESIDG